MEPSGSIIIISETAALILHKNSRKCREAFQSFGNLGDPFRTSAEVLTRTFGTTPEMIQALPRMIPKAVCLEAQVPT